MQDWYRFLTKIKPDGKAFRSILFSKVFNEVLAYGLNLVKEYATYIINDQIWFTNDNFNPEPWEKRYSINVPSGSSLAERREVVKSYMVYPQSVNRLSLDYLQDQMNIAGFSDITINRNSLGTAYTKLHGNNITDTENYTIGSEPYNSIVLTGNLINEYYYQNILLLAMSIKPLDTVVYDRISSNLVLAVNDGIDDFALAIGETYDSCFGNYNGPVGIAINSTNIYVAYKGIGIIKVFDLDGNHTNDISRFVALAVNDGVDDYALAVNDGVDDYALAIFDIIDATGISINSTSIFICDSLDNEIQVFDLSGNYDFGFGSSGTGNGEFDNPTAIRITDTNIFVVDSGNNRIQMFDLSGVYVSQFGSSGTGNGEFDSPTDLEITTSNIFVTDSGNNRIQKFDLSGTFVSEFGTDLSNPKGITIYDDLIYVCDSSNGRVVKYDLLGNEQFSFNTTLDTDEIFNQIERISVNDDSIFITDSNNLVKKYNKDFTLSLNQL